MNVALYEKFNALTDQQRFDIMSIVKDTVEKGYISPYKPKDEEVLAIQVDGNWGGSWGISGAESPHPRMNVIGMLAETRFRDKDVWGWTPFGERSGISHVSPRHFFVINDVQSLEAALQAEVDQLNSQKSTDMEKYTQMFEEALKIAQEKGLDLTSDEAKYANNGHGTEAFAAHREAKGCIEKGDDRRCSYWVPEFLRVVQNASLAEGINIAARWGKLAGILKG